MNKIFAALLLLPGLAPYCAAESFTPKSYIARVLGASLTMQKAEETLKQAENNYKNALFDAALPSFTFSMSDSFYNQNRTEPRASRGDVDSSLSAAWNLYDSANGPVRKIRTARLDYESARLTNLITKQNEAVKALNRFYALYSAQQKIIIARMNLASRERQYKDTNEQYQSGTRSKIEVTQSEGDKLQSELSLAQAGSSESKALMAFNELINAEPEAAQQVVVSTLPPAIKLPLPKEDVAKALQNNLSMRLQKNALEKTRIAARSATLAAYPRLSVDASWGKRQLALFGTPEGPWGDNHTYGVGASLSFPFGFFGAQNYRDVRTQKSVLRSAELDLQNSVRALKTGVLSAQKDIELQVKARQLLEFQVAAQKDATDNLLTEYSLGGTSFLQLDSSQTKLLDASNSQITSVNDLDLALANYRVLLGENIWD